MWLCVVLSVNVTFGWRVYCLGRPIGRCNWFFYVLTSRLPTTAKGPYFAFDCKLTHFAIGGDEGEALLSGSFHFDHGSNRRVPPQWG